MIKALTIMQPNASLIAVGASRLITSRHWTDYRGPVAIYASWGFPLKQQMRLREPRIFKALAKHYEIGDYNVPHVPVKAFVGIAVLTGVGSTNNPKNLPDPNSDEYYFSDYQADRWVWRFEAARRLEIPIRCRGERLLWTPPERVHEWLDAQFQAAA